MRFQEILAGFPGRKVLIVGDVMLDEYVWGEVRRISPEAPVPVVEAKNRTYAPGGAANVAVNVTSLGGHVLLGGLVGEDGAAVQLRQVLQEGGVDNQGLLAVSDRPTTTKMRIVAHSQQLVRVDVERAAPMQAEIENALLQWTESQMEQVGACILSDYGKGIITPGFAARFLEQAQAHRRPVIVDPKGTDYTKYRGSTVLTPNLHEAERAVGMTIHTEADLLQVGEALLDLLGGNNLLITRGPQGMSLFRTHQPPVHIPTVARNVYDVTGAGDTVVSALALALAAGAPLEDAARLANRAAGIVVGKLGTARVTLEELQQGTASE